MNNPNTKNSDELEAIAALAGLAGSPSSTTEGKVPHQSTSSKASGSSIKSTTLNADEKKEDPPQPPVGEENASLPITRGPLTFLKIEKVLFGEIEISFPMRVSVVGIFATVTISRTPWPMTIKCKFHSSSSNSPSISFSFTYSL